MLFVRLLSVHINICTCVEICVYVCTCELLLAMFLDDLWLGRLHGGRCGLLVPSLVSVWFVILAVVWCYVGLLLLLFDDVGEL